MAAWTRSHARAEALWREWADSVEAHRIEAGHFFPEEPPEEIAAILRRFFV